MFVCAYVCVCTLILIVAEWILIFLLLENYGSLLWTTFFVQMDLKLLKSGGYIYLSILVGHQGTSPKLYVTIHFYLPSGMTLEGAQY